MRSSRKRIPIIIAASNCEVTPTGDLKNTDGLKLRFMCDS